MRVKAMQQVVEDQSNRLASFTAEKEAAALNRQDQSTGQGTYYYIYVITYVFVHAYIHTYIHTSVPSSM